MRELKETGLSYEKICKRLAELEINPRDTAMKWHKQTVKNAINNKYDTNGKSEQGEDQ